jgi:hypothetical protein
MIITWSNSQSRSFTLTHSVLLLRSIMFRSSRRQWGRKLIALTEGQYNPDVTASRAGGSRHLGSLEYVTVVAIAAETPMSCFASTNLDFHQMIWTQQAHAKVRQTEKAIQKQSCSCPRSWPICEPGGWLNP